MKARLKKELKVGLVIDHYLRTSVWVLRLISDINESDSASLDVVLISDKYKKQSSSQFKHKLYSFYSNLEKHRWSGTNQDRLGIDEIDLPQSEITGKVVNLDTPAANILEELEVLDLDVLINLTNQNNLEKFSNVVKAGVWSLHHQNGKTSTKTSPVGFWEVYDRSPTMKDFLTSSLGNKLLYQTVHATDDHSSPRLNQNRSYRVGFTMIIKKLDQLYELGLETFQHNHKELAVKESVSSASFRLDKPRNLQMIFFLISNLLNSLKMRVMNRLFVEQWSMRYRLTDGLSMDFSQFKKMTSPMGGLWADPFIVCHDDAYYLFFEDAISDQKNADISVIKIDEDGTLGEIKPCLIRPYHLSYPFVFLWEGEYYMIPESKNNKTIEVYKATHFPDEWEFHSNLMEDIEAVDTTLLFKNNKWWLFTNCTNYKGLSSDTELSIYYADSPLSQEWTLHPMSPVVSDVRRARSAGRIYEHDGKLIRPAQDSSIRYGYGFRLNEIVTLTETDYEEREIDFIEPWEPMMLGTHTIAWVKNLTVIDVLEWRTKFF